MYLRKNILSCIFLSVLLSNTQSIAGEVTLHSAKETPRQTINSSSSSNFSMNSGAIYQDEKSFTFLDGNYNHYPYMVYVVNTTLESAMGETIYVYAHKKGEPSDQWEYLDDLLTYWDPHTRMDDGGVEYNNGDIKYQHFIRATPVDRRIYDKVYVDGYSGTWPSDPIDINNNTPNINAKIGWEYAHMKVYINTFTGWNY